MKYIFLFSLLIFIFSCDNNMGTGKRYPIEQTHGHSHQYSDHSHEEEDDHLFHIENPNQNIDGSEGNIYASANRNLWQRPELIVQHLGDLEGKILADIGAGPNGYFSFIVAANTQVKKVLALDIDQEALDLINKSKPSYNNIPDDKLETRLVKPDDPLLENKEVNVILIAYTLTYIDNKKEYLMNLRKSLPVGGRLVIVDYKMKEIPPMFPPRSQRMPLYEMEDLVEESGFKRILTDDYSLGSQYVVVALNL